MLGFLASPWSPHSPSGSFPCEVGTFSTVLHHVATVCPSAAQAPDQQFRLRSAKRNVTVWSWVKSKTQINSAASSRCQCLWPERIASGAGGLTACTDERYLRKIGPFGPPLTTLPLLDVSTWNAWLQNWNHFALRLSRYPQQGVEEIWSFLRISCCMFLSIFWDRSVALPGRRHARSRVLPKYGMPSSWHSRLLGEGSALVISWCVLFDCVPAEPWTKYRLEVFQRWALTLQNMTETPQERIFFPRGCHANEKRGVGVKFSTFKQRRCLLQQHAGWCCFFRNLSWL